MNSQVPRENASVRSLRVYNFFVRSRGARLG
jgi:hypothetical protein